MVKIKEYSKRCICILSACVCFLITVFCPFDNFFAADELVYGDPVTKSISFDVNTQFMETNTTLPVSRDSARYDDYTLSTHYFYRHFPGAEIINGEPDVYAYYIKIENTSVDTSKSFNCFDFGFMVGAAHQTDDLSGLKLEVDNNQVAGSVWLVNDYADINYYLVPYGYFYSTIKTEDSGTVTQTKPYLIFKATYDVTVYAYTIDEYTDVLLNQILTELELHGDLTEELKTLLEDALYSDSGMSLADQLSSVNNYLSSIQYSYLLPMKDMLNSIEIRAREILAEEQKQTTWLENIYNAIMEYFGLSGENSDQYEEAPEDTSMIDLDQKEDALLGDTNPDDAAGNLSVELDADSNALIWDIINDFVTCNGVVFGSFISILSLGVVALILGR